MAKNDPKREAISEILYRELFNSYVRARSGKRSTYDELKYEANYMQNLAILRDDLLENRFEPGRSEVHIIHQPVDREIFAANFRDRIVHWWVFNWLAPFYEKRFLYDCYSCRKGKGTLFGIQRLAHHIRSVSQNYTIPTTVVKMDISAFFNNIPRHNLLNTILGGVEKMFKGNHNWRYRILRRTLTKIIMDDPVKGCILKSPRSEWSKIPRRKSLFFQRKGVGIVIGNLTSQLFSNVYLSRLDYFIVGTLGYSHYGRYVDDFYFVVPTAQLAQAKVDVEKIKQFLLKLGLGLNPQKIKYLDINYGVEFLGAVVYPYRIVVGRRLQAQMRQAVYQIIEQGRDLSSLQSYLGHVMNFNGFKTVLRIFDQYGIYLEEESKII